MSEILAARKYDAVDDILHVTSWQDVEPYLEDNKRKRDKTYRGDWHPKFSLPNVMVEKFYFEFTAGGYRPMGQEFWDWVDRRIMSDPDLKAFRTGGYNFRVGYSG